jgi:hypothetical protein
MVTPAAAVFMVRAPALAEMRAADLGLLLLHALAQERRTGPNAIEQYIGYTKAGTLIASGDTIKD